MPLPAAIPKRSLSTKLLVLTTVFVLLAELVVMIPSVSKQRVEWFTARLEAAYLVSTALEDPHEGLMEEDTARQLFATANILGVTVNRNEMRMLILAPQIDPHGPPHMHRVDLRDHSPLAMIAAAWATVFSKGDDLIQVTGEPRFANGEAVDIIVSQKALRRDLLVYARNILGLSLVISSLTAALLFWALKQLIINPVRRLTDNMTAFEAEPERADRILAPSSRNDEIGAAERSLAKMEGSLVDLLNERRRLAALGAGISKISHDLRNILASAQLMSDRLAKSEDPQVRKLSPRLISALDRAIVLSRDTLAFGRMSPSSLTKAPTNLHALAAEALDDAAAMGVVMENRVPEALTAEIDRTQLYRSLFNLVKNAVDALGAGDSSDPDRYFGAVAIEGEAGGGVVTLRVRDDGPGVPPIAREALFEPFKGSQKAGGTGLGLAIAHEIVRAHGGRLALESTGEDGTVFRIDLPGPDHSVDAAAPDSQTPSRRGSAPPSKEPSPAALKA